MIGLLIEYLLVFMIGAMAGWCLEVLYRRYFGLARKWINPGFLSGPYLPIYGSAMSLLYIISEIPTPLWMKVPLYAMITTGIEYVTGLFFLKKYKTRLWDYSKLKFNFQGIIAPLYTIFWTFLSLVFYYLIYPRFGKPIAFIYGHLEYSLFIGIFYGVFFLDMWQSFNVLNRLREIAKTIGNGRMIIDYDQLKLDIMERFDELSTKVIGIGGKIEDFGDRLENIGEKLDFGEKLEVLNGRMRKSRIKLRKPTYMRPFSGDININRHLKDHFDKRKDSVNRKDE